MAYLATICAGEKEKEILFFQTKRYEKMPSISIYKCQASTGGMAISRSFDFVHDTFEKIPIRLNSIVYHPSLCIQFFWLIKIFWARTVIQERKFRLL